MLIRNVNTTGKCNNIFVYNRVVMDQALGRLPVNFVASKSDTIAYFQDYQKQNNLILDYNESWVDGCWRAWMLNDKTNALERSMKYPLHVFQGLLELRANPMILYRTVNPGCVTGEIPSSNENVLMHAIRHYKESEEHVRSILEEHRKIPYEISPLEARLIVTRCDTMYTYISCMYTNETISEIVRTVLESAKLDPYVLTNIIQNLYTKEIAEIVRQFIPWSIDNYVQFATENMKVVVQTMMSIRQIDGICLCIIPRELMFEIFSFI